MERTMNSRNLELNGKVILVVTHIKSVLILTVDDVSYVLVTTPSGHFYFTLLSIF